MTVDNNKIVLQKTLGKLLGFEDGAEDVLDHLLTIESGDVSESNVKSSLCVLSYPQFFLPLLIISSLFLAICILYRIFQSI